MTRNKEEGIAKSKDISREEANILLKNIMINSIRNMHL